MALIVLLTYNIFCMVKSIININYQINGLITRITGLIAEVRHFEEIYKGFNTRTRSSNEISMFSAINILLIIRSFLRNL